LLSTTSSLFDQIESTFQQSGTESALAQLANALSESKKYHELFEARKLQLRCELGLPLLSAESVDQLDEPVQNQLEDGLAKICREIGSSLMEQGKLREGWMYLRPVGENELARDFVMKTEPDDENIDELIELSLREGISPAHGFSLVLKHYGTCNSITTYDSELSQHSLEDQRAAAGMLVEHLHAELLENVRSDVQQEEGKPAAESTFAEILADREWLFDGDRYHIDTTHLSSVIRFSRKLLNESQIALAIDLTEYGRRLSSQYQYESEEPFEDLYPTTRLYLDAVSGVRIEEALEFFGNKARGSDAYNEGYMTIEVYIELLARTGRHAEAIENMIQLMPDASPKIGIAPNILELSNQSGDFHRFTDFCRKHDDLLGFVTGLLHQGQAEKGQAEKGQAEKG
jgi:hypothetical protein